MAGNKDDLPSAAEFGQWRQKLARRGIPQAWIDINFGTGINGRTRGEIDADLRAGYAWNQISPGAGTVDMPALTTYLTNEGWRCFGTNNRLFVLIEIGGEELTQNSTSHLRGHP